ncbi:glycosyltransferase family 2 protein [Pseudomonas nicosulfuronedens]
MELTILMPCLNEAETLKSCIRKGRAFLREQGISGEVLVADNGSDDGSVELAEREGARVIHVAQRGYGSALIAGVQSAQGHFVIMGDSDDSYDFSRLQLFVEKLREGYQLVMGNRFRGGIATGAMPALHRYLGNPVLSFIGRLLYSTPARDFHCGLRGFDRRAVLDLGLNASGMEFASEMVVKASLHRLRVCEVPTTLSPDGRSRPPHLRSWRDGWRHLRFLLMMSPRWLLLYPGLALLSLGMLSQLLLLRGPLFVSHVAFDIHTMLFVSGMTVLGVQLVLFALITRAVGQIKGLLPETNRSSQVFCAFTLERGILLGLSLFGGGMFLAVLAVFWWSESGLSALDPRVMMRIAIPSVTLILSGLEVFFASFVLSFIDPLGSYGKR